MLGVVITTNQTTESEREQAKNGEPLAKPIEVGSNTVGGGGNGGVGGRIGDMEVMEGGGFGVGGQQQQQSQQQQQHPQQQAQPQQLQTQNHIPIYSQQQQLRVTLMANLHFNAPFMIPPAPQPVQQQQLQQSMTPPTPQQMTAQQQAFLVMQQQMQMMQQMQMAQQMHMLQGGQIHKSTMAPMAPMALMAKMVCFSISRTWSHRLAPQASIPSICLGETAPAPMAELVGR